MHTSTSLKGASLIAAVSVLITACGYPMAGTSIGDGPTSVVAKKVKSASLTVKPVVQAGGYKTQAAVNNYTRDSIDHLVIKIYTVNGMGEEQPVLDDLGNPIQATMLNSELNDPVNFGNLFLYTTYRIRCLAYKAPGEAAEDLISTVDENSYVDVALTNDDRPTMTTLKVKLIDVEFDGQGTANGIAVTDGGYKERGSVTITKGTSTP